VASKSKKAPKPATKVYRWKPGSRHKVPAQVAGEELARIARESGGQVQHVTPKAVVDASRPFDAPLHPSFEWRDDVAGELYREQQARWVIKDVEVLIEKDDGSEPDPMRQFVHVEIEDVGSCYGDTIQVMSDEELRAQTLREARSLLKGIAKRYRDLEELGPIIELIDQLDGDDAA
jgi:hypothetical protein